MTQVSIRFLIGLSCNSDPMLMPSLIQARRTQALAALNSWYGAGGVYDGVGYWQGIAEPCLMFETLHDDLPDRRDRAREYARALARMLRQEAIGLVFTSVEYSEVSQ